MNQKEKRKPLVKWQKPNVGVMIALVPAIIASIYYFGWRSLLLLFVVTVAGFLTEYIFLQVYYKEPVSSAVFVSSFLLTLSLPPTIPICQYSTPVSLIVCLSPPFGFHVISVS